MPTTRTALLATLVVVGVVRAAAAQPGEEPPSEPTPAPAPVITPPSVTPSVTPVVPPKPDDFDLSSVGLDPTSAVDDKLNIYGFADFTYAAFHIRNPTPLVADSRSFGVGNLNIYLSKNLTPRWRTLAEVRFLFAPNGDRNAQTGVITNTTATDPANTFRPIEWGGIRIERVYLEYELDSKLTIRAGHFLSPYGIWNIDHGSPAIIPVLRPYVIGEQFIPEHQTGIDAFGSTYFGDYKLEYHATVSNGRHPAEATQDPDMKLAFGGRLALTAPLFAGTLDLGVSAYRGRYTSLATTVLAPPAVSFDEVAYAADLVWKREGFIAQGEIMRRDRRYLVDQRPILGAGFQPNGRDLGAYGLAGYRFDHAWNVMPYALYEYYKPLERVLFGKMRAGTVGLNFRPTPTIVLKTTVSAGQTEGAGQFGELGRVYYFTGQAAWVF